MEYTQHKLTQDQHTYIGESVNSQEFFNDRMKNFEAEFGGDERANWLLHIIITKKHNVDQMPEKFATLDQTCAIAHKLESLVNDGKVYRDIEYNCTLFSCEPREMNFLVAICGHRSRRRDEIERMCKIKCGLNEDFLISVYVINNKANFNLSSTYMYCVEGRYKRYEEFPSFWSEVEEVVGRLD